MTSNAEKLKEWIDDEKLTKYAEETRQTLANRLNVIPFSHIAIVTEKTINENSGPYENDSTNTNQNQTLYEEFNERAGTESPLALPTPDSDGETLSVAVEAISVRTISSKHGMLYRKDKFIFVDQFRRCWAAVAGNYFYIYSSDKDYKPIASYYLEDYKAREAPHIVRDAKKKSLCFEIVSPGKKSYQFMAKSEKDMLQWVAALNMDAERVCSVLVSSVTSDANTEVFSKNRTRRLPSLPDETVIYDDAVGAGASMKEEHSDLDESPYEPMFSPRADEPYYDIADLPPEAGSELASSHYPASRSQSAEAHRMPIGSMMQEENSYSNIETESEVPPPIFPKSARRTRTGSQCHSLPDNDIMYDDVSCERKKNSLANNSRAPGLIASSLHSKLANPNVATRQPSAAKATNAAAKPLPPPAHHKPSTTKRPEKTMQPSQVQVAKQLEKLFAPQPPPQRKLHNGASSFLHAQMQKTSTPNTSLATRQHSFSGKTAQSSDMGRPSHGGKTFVRPLPVQFKMPEHGPQGTSTVFKNIVSGNIKDKIKQMESRNGGAFPVASPSKFAPLLTDSDNVEYETIDDDIPELPPRP